MKYMVYGTKYMVKMLLLYLVGRYGGMLSRFFYIRITPGFFGRGEGADFFPTVLTRIFFFRQSESIYLL